MDETRATLIEALRASALGGPAELLETHISWVLLSGDAAYKIKKPVNFGFVDFSTLEKREQACRDELRLNSRFAPDLYVGVVPITGTPESPRWGGAGPPIEFAVQMRRFPQEALLPRVLERGALLPEHVDQLAREVADFHRATDVAAADSPFGDVDGVSRPIAENFRQLARFPHPDARRAQIQRLQEWSLGEHLAHRDAFAARKRDGFIRECHGDLHLGNLLLHAGRVRLFDCLEFNERLRWIDVISDVAFLVMDLRDRGRADFAGRFLNAYLEQTGDYAGLKVFHYYFTYRALVRAKVACLRQEQADVSSAERQRLEGELEKYLNLAERSTRARTPALIVTHGLSGSGKTFQTGPLIEQWGAIRIRSDVERKRLVPPEAAATLPAGIDAGRYDPGVTQRTYERLSTLAAAPLAAGFPVIVDAACLQRAQRDMFRALAAELRVPFQILNFEGDPALFRERIAARAAAGRDASEATAAVLEHQMRTREPLTEDELAACLTVDVAHPLDLAALAFRLELGFDPTGVSCRAREKGVRSLPVQPRHRATRMKTPDPFFTPRRVRDPESAGFPIADNQDTPGVVTRRVSEGAAVST